MRANDTYYTNVTDAQWRLVKPLLPKAKKRGRKRQYTLRSILNGVLYLEHTGCQWRLLPKNFPPWESVYGYFRRWCRQGLWQHIHDSLRAKVRQKVGKKAEATAGILDSQTVKTGGQGGPRGYDGAKKTTGRKRHVVVDTLGLIWGVIVTAADWADRDGAVEVICRLIGTMFLGSFKLFWADSAYQGDLVDWVHTLPLPQRIRLEIVRGLEGQKGFQVQPRRWIVERTFGWLVRRRRLVRDYEARELHSESMIYIGMIAIMLKRLA